MERHLALELASTIRHDGQGGVADDLETVDGLECWVRARFEPLREAGVGQGFVADEETLAEVVALRRAVRALFARVVSPAPPSPADAHRLMPVEEALGSLNGYAAREPVTPWLHWPADGRPTARLDVDPSTQLPARVRLLAVLARATVDFLAGPECGQLRACTAPRCVRYFLKSHGRQAWCKPSCGNRARVARHYQRQRAADKPES